MKTKYYHEAEASHPVIKVEQYTFDPVDLPEGRILTLAATVKSDMIKKASSVQFGFSIKNPMDETPDQKIGNIIALGRSEKKPCAAVILEGQRIPKQFIKKFAELLQEDFKYRLNNYVQFSTKRQVQSKQTTVVTG